MYSKNPLINLFKYSWHYSFDRKKWFVFVIVFSVIGNSVWLMQPIVIGKIFNSIQFSAQSDQLRNIGFGAVLLVALNTLGWLFHGTSRIVENINAFLIEKNYRQTMFEKVMDLPTAWHKDHHSGDTIDKIEKAGDRLNQFAGEIFVVLQNIVGLTVSIAVLAFYDLKTIVIALFAAVVAILVILKFDERLLAKYKLINKAENFISAGIFDYISNFMTIISLRLKGRAAKEMENRSMKHLGLSVRSYKINELKWFLSSTIIWMMTAVVLYWNAYGSIKTQGVVVIGTLFILYQYLSRIGGVFYTFAWKYSDTVRQNSAIVAAQIIEDEYSKLHLAKKYALPADWNVIQIKKLFFFYKEAETGKNETKALSDVSMHIERGKKIALIGTSGSGKSTILSLLRGLHPVDSASVFCDGKKLEKELRHIFDHCSLIPQEPEIFNNTIEYNICLGVRIEKKKLFKFIAMANLSDLISRLPQGLKTSVLEKGVSLSGGEKQRLALARGLMAAEDSPLLLLDEPTSSVDVANESEIYENIFKNFKDKTIISAIHSLHLLKNFDYIYMFKDSRIIAEGTFHEILEDENFKVLWQNYNAEIEKK
ncbi:MAG TPA: ABC transporter ATP-binding protein [Candidatus Bathyarchaeia archaeon]|nr:ABC transporter ATP-binding protein [Candidatus Bathyarchaeia archaeon]